MIPETLKLCVTSFTVLLKRVRRLTENFVFSLNLHNLRKEDGNERNLL